MRRAQRAYRLVGHGDAPVLSELQTPHLSRQDAPLSYRVGGTPAQHPYRASGLGPWHRADINRCPLNGRYGVKSGRDMLQCDSSHVGKSRCGAVA